MTKKNHWNVVGFQRDDEGSDMSDWGIKANRRNFHFVSFALLQTKVVISFPTLRVEKSACHANINPNKMCICFQDKLWNVNFINILK